jgi:hypothetical protein
MVTIVDNVVLSTKTAEDVLYYYFGEYKPEHFLMATPLDSDKVHRIFRVNKITGATQYSWGRSFNEAWDDGAGDSYITKVYI